MTYRRVSSGAPSAEVASWLASATRFEEMMGQLRRGGRWTAPGADGDGPARNRGRAGGHHGRRGPRLPT